MHNQKTVFKVSGKLWAKKREECMLPEQFPILHLVVLVGMWPLTLSICTTSLLKQFDTTNMHLQQKNTTAYSYATLRQVHYM